MGDKRRVDAGLVLICQTNMRYDGAAALGHANGLGGAHPPISGFGCLREHLAARTVPWPPTPVIMMLSISLASLRGLCVWTDGSKLADLRAQAAAVAKGRVNACTSLLGVPRDSGAAICVMQRLQPVQRLSSTQSAGLGLLSVMQRPSQMSARGLRA